MSLKPGFVESNMSKKKKGLEAISAKECASGTLNQLGFVKATSGHWYHEITSFLLDYFDKLPSFIHSLVFNYMYADLEAFISKQS